MRSEWDAQSAFNWVWTDSVTNDGNAHSLIEAEPFDFFDGSRACGDIHFFPEVFGFMILLMVVIWIVRLWLFD